MRIERPGRGSAARAALTLWLVVAAPWPAAGAGSAEPSYRPGELILKLRTGAAPERRERLLDELGAREWRSYPRLGATLARLSGISVEEALRRCAADPDVVYAEPNYLYRHQLTPNDPGFDQQWSLSNLGQSGGVVGADIGAISAWNTFTGTRDVVVAIIDSGIDAAHPDLRDNVYVNPGEIPDNLLDDDGNGFVDDVRGWNFVSNNNDTQDDNGHGTHVAGTVGAVGNNGVGVTGVNWAVTLLPVKFTNRQGVGTAAAALLAVEYAVQMGADVINASWGGGGASLALRDAIALAGQQGILFVAAAGNSNPGVNNDTDPTFPASYELESILSVAATNDDDRLWIGSHYGVVSVDLGAPGVSILSTIPNDAYAFSTGTSMAAPHVAGTVALMLGRYPDLSLDQVRARLLETVDPLESLSGRVATGGRLNTFAALSDPDDIPPGDVSDLAAALVGSSRLELQWTAPGDDGFDGVARRYDARVSPTPIPDLAAFEQATRVVDLPEPRPAGTVQTVRVSGLAPERTYYLALRTFDDFGNASGISNVVEARTLGPPSTSVSPTSLEADLFTGEKTMRSLLLTNAGVGEYVYRVDALDEARARLTPPRPGDVRTGGIPPTLAPGLATSFLRSPVPYAPATAQSWAEVETEQALPPQADTNGIRVLILQSAALVADIQGRLRSQPGIGTVDVYDGTFLTPRVEDLARYDAVVVVANSPFFDPTAVGNALADYADSGGGVVLTLASFIQGFQIAGRFLSGGYLPYNLGSGPAASAELGEFDPDHPIMAGVTELTGNLLGAVSLAPDAELVASWDDGRPLAATRGNNVVAINLYVASLGFWSGDAPLLLRNAVFWSSRLVTWVRADPDEGEVLGGETEALAVRFDAAGLPGGEYEASLVFRGNDPLAQRRDVPVLLRVRDAADIAVTPPALDFGEVFLGETVRRSLAVANLGTTTLSVDEVALEGAGFTAEDGPFQVEPGGQRELEVTFQPPLAGEAGGTLRLTSNDPDEGLLEVALVARVVRPPELTITPPSLTVQLLSGQSTDRTLDLANAGGAELTYTVGVKSLETAAPAPLGEPGESAILGQPGTDPFRLFEDFEDGDLEGWAVQPSQSLKEVTQETAANGSRFSHHQEARQTGHFNGIRRELDDVQPGYVGFWIRPGSRTSNDAYFVLRDRRGCSSIGGCEAVWFYAREDGRFFVNANIGGNASVDYQSGVWYHIEFKRIDFQTKTFEYWVDGERIQDRVPMRNPAVIQSIANVDLYSFDEGGEAWWDEITLADREPPQAFRVTPVRGTIPAESFTALDVRFDTSRLSAGLHSAEIVIESNDPARPRQVVPAALNVVGAADIELLGDAIDFGSLLVGTESSARVRLANDGTDPLVLESVEASLPDYLALMTERTVLPGEQAEIDLVFRPTAPGVRAAELLLRSNDPDEPEVAVRLKGVGVLPPRLTVDPPSLQQELFNGGLATRTLTLGNVEGDSPLHYELRVEQGERQPTAGGGPAWLPAAGPATWTATTQSGLDTTLALPGDPVQLAEDFEDGDLFGWNDVGGGGFKEVTDETAADGSLRSYHESNSGGGRLSGIFRLLPGIRPGYVSFWVRPGSEIAFDSNVALLGPTGLDGIQFYAAPDGNFHVNPDVGGRTDLPYRAGRWYRVEFRDIDFESGTFDYYVDRVLAQEAVPLRNRVFVPAFHRLDLFNFDAGAEAWWDEIVVADVPPREPVRVSPISGVVQAGDSHAIEVIFDARGLEGGRYPASLVLTTNDPARPESRIPATCDVLDAADIELSRDLLDFGAVFVGATVEQSVVVANRGTRPLVIGTIDVEPDVFGAEIPLPRTLAPGETLALAVRFRPGSVGSRSGRLLIGSNDPDETAVELPLAGSGEPGPEAQLTPQKLDARLLTGQSRTSTLQLRNAGPGPLTWTTSFADGGDAPTWLELAPRSGSLPPGAATTLTVVLDAGGLDGGEYLATILLLSDDPFRPEIHVPLRLTVEAAADLEIATDPIEIGDVFLGSAGEAARTVRNAGVLPLRLQSIEIADPDFAVSPATLVLAPGQSEVLRIRFEPLEVGQRETTLALVSDDPDESLVVVAVRAAGLQPPEAAVTPTAFEETLFSGETLTRRISLTNLAAGGTDLSFDIEVDPQAVIGGLELASDASVETTTGEPVELRPADTIGDGVPLPDLPRLPGATAAAPQGDDGVLFGDDFEDGDFDGWLRGGLLGEREVTDVTAADGTTFSYHEFDSAAGHLDGIYRELPNLRPSYISFWVRLESRTDDAGYFVLRDSAGREVIFFHADALGRFFVNAETGGDNSVFYEAGRWYHIELKNIDFANKVFDYFVDRRRIRRRISFRNAPLVQDVKRVDLYNFTAQSEAWWDEIVLASEAPFTPIRVEPERGEVPGGATADVAVLFDAVGLNAGDYLADIVIRTNDPDNPQLVVPAGLRVDGEPDAGLSRTELDFGSVFAGTESSRIVTITNFGTDDLVVSDVDVEPAGLFTPDIRSFSLGPDRSRGVTVTFRPFTGGVTVGSLVFRSNDPDNPELTVTLRGEARIPARIALDPDSLEERRFLGELSTRTLTLGNAGGTPLDFSVTLMDADGTPVDDAIVVFDDDMEMDGPGWITEVYAGRDLWHRTERDANSGASSWWCGDEASGSYGIGERVSNALISPPIDLRHLDGFLVLAFWEHYRTEPVWDECLVDVSIDGGRSWMPLRGEYGMAPSGDSLGWKRRFLDLAPFAGELIRVRFYFETFDDSSNNRPGWYVDDVQAIAVVAPWLDVTPDAGRVEPGTTGPLQVVFDGLERREPRVFDGLIGIDSNDPFAPRIDLPVRLDLAAPPRLALPGSPVTLESTLDAGDRGTMHRLVLPRAPAGPGEVELTLEGNHAGPDDTATLSVEGFVLGRSGGAREDCGMVQGSFTLAAAALEQVFRDGLAELDVRDSASVGEDCDVHRHGVQLRYPAVREVLDFGEGRPGAIRERELPVTNTGDGLLVVDDVVGPQGILVSPAAFQIPPRSTRTLSLSWVPAAPGVLEDELRFTSNDPFAPVRTLALRGVATEPPPRAEIDLEAIVAALPPRTELAAVETLRLRNTGAGDLVWSVETADSFVTVEPASGTITGGTSTKLTVYLRSTELDDGDYTTQLVFTTNDPGRERIELPVVLHVAQVELDRFLVDPSPKYADRPGTIEAILQLPPAYRPGEVQLDSVSIHGVSAEAGPVTVKDLDGDGVGELILQFDAARLMETMPGRGVQSMTIRGEIRDRAWFTGRTYLRGVVVIVP